MRTCSEQPPSQYQADDQALEPDQCCHLIVAEAKFFLNPVKCLLICEEDGTNRTDNPFHGETLVRHIVIAGIEVRQGMVLSRYAIAACEGGAEF